MATPLACEGPPGPAWRGQLMLISAWVAVSLTGAWGLLQLEIREAKYGVHRQAEVMHAELQDRAILNDAAIEGLSAVLQICPKEDATPARSYARSVLDRYPHIYMLGAARPVGRAERDAFEALMQAQGFTHAIRRFDYQGDRLWHSVPEKAVYYPVQFAEPEIEATWSIHGLDLGAVPLFRATLERSLRTDQPVASGAFELTTGRRAFGLMRAVCHLGTGPCEANGLRETPRFLAILVVFADTILDCRDAALRGYSCAVWLDSGELGPQETLLVEEQAAGTVSRFERALLPRVDYRMPVTGASQPLVLDLSHQLSRDSVSLLPPLTLLLLSAAGLAVALRSRRQRERSERERAVAYRTLDVERASLEIRVHERTEQLLASNEDLQRENRAREAAEKALRRKSGQLRLLARQLMDVQESERRSLARELHDDIGQTLTALRTHAQLIRQEHASPEDVCVRSADTIFGLSGQLYESTHRIMRRLRPRALDDLGLAGALQTCIDSAGLEALGVTVHTGLCGELEGLEDAVAITVYRLLQEALTNVARHAGARNVWIKLWRGSPADSDHPAGDRLWLTVEDDGRGMQESVLDKDRLGLLGAQERVEALGGSFAVEHGAAGGVLLRAEIPLERS
jgi:two-component system, NarL family, sensor histidine kinase UhpB